MSLVSHTYWPNCIKMPPKPQVSKKIMAESDEELAAHLEQLVEDTFVLIFTTEATATVILSNIPGAVMVTQDTDADSLRRGDTRMPACQFSVFVVTDRSVMIGTDFKAPTTGMTLILDRGLESEREALQALSRVGRYGERCVRMITSRASLVDEKLNKGLVKRLIDY